VPRLLPEHEVEEFYKKYVGPLFGMARRIVESDQAAEDIVHDVFVAFILAVGRGRIDADAHPVAYLFRSVTNASFKYLRKRATRDLAEASAVPGSIPGPSIGRIAVITALAKLSEDDQHLLTLVSFGGLSPAEIAAMLGTSEPTIRKRLQRARARLIQALDPSSAPSTHDR